MILASDTSSKELFTRIIKKKNNISYIPRVIFSGLYSQSFKVSSQSGSSKGYKGVVTSKKLEPKKLSTIQKEEEERKELIRQQQEQAALQEQLQEVRLQK